MLIDTGTSKIAPEQNFTREESTLRDLRKQVGATLQALRLAQELSQTELGARAGLSYTHVGSIERALKSPTIDTLERLARALDVDVTVLVGGTKKPGAKRSPDPLRRVVALLRGQPLETIDLSERILREVVRVKNKKRVLSATKAVTFVQGRMLPYRSEAQKNQSAHRRTKSLTSMR